MPGTTYLNQSEISQYPYKFKDIEISELLEELCATTQEDWVILEKVFEEKRFFKKTIRVTYRLLKNLGNGEYQEIQFYRPSDDFVRSMGTGAPAESVAAYMIGFLSGLARREAISK